MSDSQNCCKEQDEKNTSSPVKLVAFKDCSLEEKVLRLHAEVYSTRQTNAYLARSIEELRCKLHNLYTHNHVDGDVVIKIKDVNNSPGYGIGQSLSPSFDYLA